LTEKSLSDILSPELERKELIELAQFVLSRKTRDIRNELTKYLIARVVSKYAKEREGVLERDLSPLIELEYRLPDFPELFIHSALENMIAEESFIIRDSAEGRRYFLKEIKQGEIESLAEKYQELRRSAMDELVQRIESDYGKLSELQAELVLSVFFSLIGSILVKHTVNCAQAITYGKGEPSKVLEYPDFRTQLDTVLSKISEQKLRDSLSKVIRNMLLNPSKDLLNFLHSMAQGYVILQILNLDPNCIQLERASLAKRKVYLDTNIIIAIVCSGDESHQAVVDLTKLTTKLGVQLIFSARTKAEFLRRFKESTALYQRISGISKDVTRKAMELMPDPFIKSYRIEKGAGSGSGWGWFSAKMQNVEVILKDEFQIEFDLERKDEILKHGDLEQLTSIVYRAAYPTKSENVAKHDAFHILLINELRKEETPDELGTNYWFLTLDYTLDEAEREFAKETEQRQRLASSIHASTWLDMISTFMSPDIAREEAATIFAELLASELPALTTPINSYDIADLIGPWMDDPNLGTETIRRIVGNEFVRETLGSFREAKARGEEISLGEVVTPILETLRHEIENKYASTIAEMKSGDEKRTREVEEMKKEIEKFRNLDARVTGTRRPLLVFGTLSFILLSTFAVLQAFLKWNFPDIIYNSLLILTIVLLGSAAFGRLVLERYLA